MTEERAFKRIWTYMHMAQGLRPADMLLVLGSYDTRVPEWAAGLFLDGWAPLITASGGGDKSDVTGNWDRPEAQVFADIMRRRGVPVDKILIEDRSNNTGENAYLAGELWKQQGLDPKTVIVATQPYMERRAFATLAKWWPERELIMTSPPVEIAEWMEHGGTERRVIENALVGDLWRIREYPAKGFQIEQDIPTEVWEAYEFLTERGYGRAERLGPKTRPPA